MDKTLKAVIIDDMPLAIASLKADIEENDLGVEIIGTANGVISGAKLLQKEDPDLIFLDIHMEDGDGFDLLDIIEQGKYQVIFTTASNDHAVKAFQFSATDYLLKPVDIELLRSAIGKIRSSSSTVNKFSTKGVSPALNTQEEIRIVDIEKIVRLEASGNYTQFYFDENEKLLVTRTLKEFEKSLPGFFIRTHQSHLVNRNYIRSYVKTEGGYLLMKNGHHVPVSVRKKSLVIDLLSK